MTGFSVTHDNNSNSEMMLNHMDNQSISCAHEMIAPKKLLTLSSGELAGLTILYAYCHNQFWEGALLEKNKSFNLKSSQILYYPLAIF